MNETQKKLKFKDQVLISNLEIADSFFSRAKGLLGTKKLNQDQGLWIHQCNSIHTFFMNYTIDCIFIDKNLVVQKIFQNVKPYRMTLPVFKANSVIEVAAGVSNNWNLKSGDQLHVSN